uniref:Carboxylesterase type B domain-containing protein n=1 Tax=Kwoniella bestiolae CBS 10118 TaxID=1296100 RepID=A0A1B9G4B1_9TREE|nr:hypothetical protein I302_03563 [Kwoniella bestiolae CBS 10118]OCF25887.1 hypothetical protein I302_03563 [Kwoniella bestiolae CBS 10118]
MILLPLLSLPLAFTPPITDLSPRKVPSTQHDDPTVTLTNCEYPITLTGKYDGSFNQDLYLGVPYAQPPIGSKRFRTPEPYVYTEDLQVTEHAPACLQVPNTTADGIYGMSEDLVVYIHGGSFIEGTASIYNASWLVARSQEIDKPVITVVANFRLGVIGFGYGSGFAENNAANLALRDNIAALRWVGEHIEAFGGDPQKVTVLGGSLGAVAISLLYLNPEFDLFRSAIMSSGAQNSPPMGPTDSTWEDSYQRLLEITNCTLPDHAETAFECLRCLPAEVLLEAQFALQADPRWSTSFIFAPSIDGDLIPKSPFELLEEGRFAKIPFIAGNVKDEGTYFTSPQVNSSSLFAVLNAIEPVDPAEMLLEKLVKVYTDNPALGSPFDTANETFGLDPRFKQSAAIFGDVAFQGPRRHFLRSASRYGLEDIWTYQFEQISPDRPAYLGVSHATDVPYFFGRARPGVGDPHYLQFNYTEEDHELSNAIMDYWINFIYYTDPNSPSGKPLPEWPRYDSSDSGRNMLKLKYGDIGVITDDYREENMDVIYRNYRQFNYKRDVNVDLL